jgi:lysophospholipase L1-like esterase
MSDIFKVDTSAGGRLSPKTAIEKFFQNSSTRIDVFGLRWRWIVVALFVMGMALSAIFVAKGCVRGGKRSDGRDGLPGFCVRDGLPILRAKLKAGKPVHLAFLGGSITQNAGKNGFVTALPEWIRSKYPGSPVGVTNAGLSGTGSDRGAKRLDRDVLASKPDLVFVEFAVNDGARDSLADMEQIVRKTLESNPEAEFVFLYTTSDGAFKQTTKGKIPEAIRNHEKVARHYGIPSVTLGSDLRKRLFSGESNWGDLFADACHPTEQGYDSYNRDLVRAFEKILAAGDRGAGKLRDPMPSGGAGAGP